MKGHDSNDNTCNDNDQQYAIIRIQDDNMTMLDKSSTSDSSIDEKKKRISKGGKKRKEGHEIDAMLRSLQMDREVVVDGAHVSIVSAFTPSFSLYPYSSLSFVSTL